MEKVSKKHLINSGVLFVFLTLTACAVFKSLLPVIIALSLLITALIIWQPLTGFCLMVFFIPLENITLLFPSFTLIKLIGIITLWGWIIHLILGKKVIKTSNYLLLITVYLLWCLFSITWAIEPGQSWQRIISMSQLFLMFILGYNLAGNKKETYIILSSYIMGALLSSFLGIYYCLLDDFSTRAGIGDPNFYARLLSLGILFSFYFVITDKNIYIKLLNLAGCFIMFFSVLISGSRGTWAALLITAAAGLVLYRKPIIQSLKNKKVLTFIFIILIFTAAITPTALKYLPPVVTQRAETLTQIPDMVNRVDGRLDIWVVGAEIAKDNLLLGVGLNNFPYAYTEYWPQEFENVIANTGLNRDPHNDFLANLAELGIPGLLLFISILFYMWRLAGRTENRADSVLCKLIVVFLVIAGLTCTDHFRKFFWLSMLIPAIFAQFGILRGLPRDKKNILFISPTFPNRNNNNYGIFAYHTVQHLQSSGISTTVIAPVPYSPPFLWYKKKWRAQKEIPLKDHIKGIEIIYPRYLCLPGLRFIEWNTLFMYMAVYNTAVILNDMAKFKIIHSYGIIPAGYSGQLIAEKFNLPSTCTAIGLDIDLAGKSKTTKARIKYILQNSNQVICVGNDLAVEANKILPGISIKVIREGVDTNKFNTDHLPSDKVKNELGFNPGDRIILYVGRLVREKGVYELIESFAGISGEFKDIKLVLAGEGNEKESLKTLVKQKNIQDKVIFAGEIPHEELVKWYAASEIVILLSYHEGVPNVIKEAMSCGRPVIAAKVTGITELVRDNENGILVEPRNTEQAKTALKKLLSETELCRKMGMRGKELINESWVDWKHTAEEYKQVFNRLNTEK